MAYTENDIHDFAALVRQLLSKYKEMQNELQDLKTQLSDKAKDAKDMELLASASMHDYDMLKTAKMLEVSDGDLEKARKRINKLIRDVNRCITLLTEQQDDSPIE